MTTIKSEVFIDPEDPEKVKIEVVYEYGVNKPREEFSEASRCLRNNIPIRVNDVVEFDMLITDGDLIGTENMLSGDLLYKIVLKGDIVYES